MPESLQPDRDLLTGVVTFQAGLITLDQFAEGCALWLQRKTEPLPDILRERGWMLPDDRAHVDYLVDRRLARFHGDVQASLASCPAEVRSVLATVSSGNMPGASEQDRTRTIHLENRATTEILSATPGPRYALNTLHAAGGIGEIWLARDVELDRDVAVKRLQAQSSASTAARTRFLREAKITGKLDHPGVVPIYEVCRDEKSGESYYSMRFLKGRTLTDAVREYHRQRHAAGSDPQTLLNLLTAFGIICNTVAYAHSKGIIHRDLKCENVILGDYGEVVVIDWGLAKQISDKEVHDATEVGHTALAAASPAATLAGHILGTPAYMAPEQASGRIDLIGPATDVYGLCAILYEILCGQPPFSGRNTLEVLRKVLQVAPTPPSEIIPGVPQALEQICLRGLAKDQLARPASADAISRAVQDWVSDLAERRQAEDERERFFALSLDLLAIIDKAGQFRQVSPAWERSLGYRRDQLTSHPFVEFLAADDRPSIGQQLHDAARHQSARTFESRVLAADGKQRWISWNVTPIAKEHCVYVVGRDITELKQSQQLFQGVMQSAPDAMVLINPQGRIVMVNQQTERIFGYSQPEMLGQPVELLVPERYREQHPAHVASFFAKMGVRPMGAGLNLQGRRKNGSKFPAEISLSPIKTESGLLVAASVRNVADRIRVTAPSDTSSADPG